MMVDIIKLFNQLYMRVDIVKLFTQLYMRVDIVKLFTQLYMRVDILLTCRKHLHDTIISITGEVWAHMANLTLSLFIYGDLKWHYRTYYLITVLTEQFERAFLCFVQ
jgi:hypothetical protein